MNSTIAIKNKQGQLTKYQDEILTSYLKTRSESKYFTILQLKYESFFITVSPTRRIFQLYES